MQLRQRKRCPLLVGVFVNEQPATMAQLLEFCQLDLAQLSGDELPSFIHDRDSPLYNRGVSRLYGRALCPRPWRKPIAFCRSSPPSDRPTLLVDAYHPTLPGGTGQTADWEAAARLSQMIPGLMLAGGLNSENVARAYRPCDPLPWTRPAASRPLLDAKTMRLSAASSRLQKIREASVLPASPAAEK